MNAQSEPTNPTYDFTRPVALITGATSRIGLATARAFAAAGRTHPWGDSHPALRLVVVPRGRRPYGHLVDQEEEAELLATFLTIMDEKGPLSPDVEVRVLNAIRQAGAEIPYDESTTRPKWVIAVMNRTLDLIEG